MGHNNDNNNNESKTYDNIYESEVNIKIKINNNDTPLAINNLFMKKFNLKQIISKNLSNEELKHLSSLAKGSCSYEDQFLLFDQLFKQRPHLNKFINPSNLSKNFRDRESFIPKNFDLINYYNKNVYQKLIIMKNKEDKISKWSL